MEKWLDNNPVVVSLLTGKGVFADHMRERLVVDAEQNEADDHAYVEPEDLTLEEIEARIESDDFDIKKYMKNFRPTSCDAERLFSFCRISKEFNQSRMSPDIHSRNVFLKENERFVHMQIPDGDTDHDATDILTV